MTEILSTQGDRHEEAQLLLPWYATDRLDTDERALVSAHLAECEACRADLSTERRLAAAVSAERDDVAPTWEAFAARLDRPATPASTPRRRIRGAFDGLRRAAARPQALRWVVAAQFAAVLVLGAAALDRPAADGAYRVLGDAPPAAARIGNVLAMFRPETTEAQLRRALQASGARLVDGPTAAGAYVLEVPGGGGGGALDRLRRDPEVTLAEPIEQAPAE